MITANGVIRKTELRLNVLTLYCETSIGGKIGTAQFQMENNSENLYKILRITTNSCWEGVAGSPIRVHITIEENGQCRLCGIGNFLEEDWYDLSEKTEETTEEITE